MSWPSSWSQSRFNFWHYYINEENGIERESLAREGREWKRKEKKEKEKEEKERSNEIKSQRDFLIDSFLTHGLDQWIQPVPRTIDSIKYR